MSDTPMMQLAKNDAMADHIVTIEARLAQLEADAARLDFLEASRTFEISAHLDRHLELSHWMVTVNGADDDTLGTGSTLREAIDAARTSTTEGA